MSKRSFKDKVIVITGAASGIGKATALLMAEQGAHLAISDVDEIGLAKTATACKAKGVPVFHCYHDVSSKENWPTYVEKVLDHYGEVDGILNNAGISVNARIDEQTDEDFERVMNINFWGMVWGTQYFMPHIKKSKTGYIANISSVFSLVTTPMQSAYHSSKFAIRGYTETLMQELAESHPNISVSCILPGGIKTNIARNTKKINTSRGLTEEQQNQLFDNVAINTPEKAARTIVNGMLRKKKIILIGNDAHLIRWITRLFPIGYQKIFGYFMKNAGDRVKNTSSNIPQEKSKTIHG